MTQPALSAVAFLAVAVLTQPEPDRSTLSPTPEEIQQVNPADAEALDALLLSIARNYKSYERVSDTTHWAPEMCRSMTASDKTGVQQSASRDDDTHGRKLYFLYSADASDYWNMSLNHSRRFQNEPDRSDPWTNAIGQIVVKESFKPVEVPESSPPSTDKPPDDPKDAPHPALPADHARLGDKIFKASEPAGLFIMVKFDPESSKTDKGWVYATTSPDAQTITSRGRIASCIECHKQTDRDRLYGHQWSWPHDEDRNPIPPTRDAIAAHNKRRKAEQAPK
jgi:hypothetical protein